MKNDIRFDLQAHGYATTVVALRGKGHTLADIQNAAKAGLLLRVCRGWVASPSATRRTIFAIVAGAVITGPTALSGMGVWDAADRRLHLCLPRNSRGRRAQLTPLSAFAPDPYLHRGIVRHWTQRHFVESIDPPWRASALDSLICTAHSAERTHFIASLESAIHTGALSRAALPLLLDRLPSRFASITSELDFGAESGLESIARCRLRASVTTLQTQVEIPGISARGRKGRVDILIDAWLVIELDGDEFHDPVADRARDALLVRLGYRVHRFGYDQVLNQWPLVYATIMELLRYPPAGVRRNFLRD